MGLQELIRSDAAMQMGCALMHSLWQGAAVCFAAGVALWMMRRATAAARYCVAVAAVVLMVAWPVGTFSKAPPRRFPAQPTGSKRRLALVQAIQKKQQLQMEPGIT